MFHAVHCKLRPHQPSLLLASFAAGSEMYLARSKSLSRGSNFFFLQLHFIVRVPGWAASQTWHNPRITFRRWTLRPSWGWDYPESKNPFVDLHIKNLTLCHVKWSTVSTFSLNIMGEEKEDWSRCFHVTTAFDPLFPPTLAKCESCSSFEITHLFQKFPPICCFVTRPDCGQRLRVEKHYFLLRRLLPCQRESVSY